MWWSRIEDLHTLLDMVNQGRDFTSVSMGLERRYTPSMCASKLKQLENKAWTDAEYDVLWRLRDVGDIGVLSHRFLRTRSTILEKLDLMRKVDEEMYKVKTKVTGRGFEIDPLGDEEDMMSWKSAFEALHVAAKVRDWEMIFLLVIHGGVDVNRRDAQGRTAYYHAKTRGFHDVAAFLKKHGGR